MNDLRLLYQMDPAKKIINLEFKQINSLEPIMPLLAKFQNLESLSLHGNRLKNLPEDMGSLKQLLELDISNNLLTDLTEITESLKTLPCLTHLIINFKNQKEENYVKNSLPKLEKINKKIVNFSTSNAMYSKERRKNKNDISEQDLESMALLYDDIRNIYKDSRYMVDKELMDDYDRNIDSIMGELTEKNKAAESEVQKSCNSLAGKYALIDLCFVKLITYFYHFDKKIAVALEKIHDHQALMFKDIIDLVIEEEMKSKVEMEAVRTKKQDMYKAEIRRLKNYQTESSRQVEYLESKNRELLEKLIKYTKASAMEETLGRALKTSTNRTRSASKRDASLKENGQKVTMRNRPKHLTLHQLKEIMIEIYESKRRQNAVCVEKGQVLETLETHMYTYLNQKYGLKSLAVEWAMNIVNSIRKYGLDDPEVGTFGKILRNQIEQNFAEKLESIKESLHEGIKKFDRNNSLKETEEISINQCEQVLLYMGIKREQISVIISGIQEGKISNNCISLETFERVVLDYCMRKHDDKIRLFHQEFKTVDEDEDGVISIEELEQLMETVNKNIDVDELLPLVDPSGKGVIIYSFLLEVLMKRPETRPYFKAESVNP